MYMSQGFYIPEHVLEQIDRYVKDGTDPGSFLTAIICNDLEGAVHCADEAALRNLPAYVNYFHWEVPGQCHGSLARMFSWSKQCWEKAPMQMSFDFMGTGR